eukprot:TRINITY_DN16893_c0_g1_i2.p1 TRINITY_DN16893_c0_g1~~TRINITY_DN16893_c0_g1_i2.p1  ORF type:complete len:297 (+),score=49.06 TRINITY_DN16893_c0_g1_i2:40-930(+)
MAMQQERRLLHTFVGYDGAGYACGGRKDLSDEAAARRDATIPAVATEDDIISTKVILCGDAGVGKTALLRRLTLGTFERNYRVTIGVDFEKLSYVALGLPVDVVVWDTAGQERFKAMTKQYYKNTNAVIIVFDGTDVETFENVARRWLPELRESVDEGTPMFLVANKSDLVQKVGWEEAAEFASANRLELWGASVKDDVVRVGRGPPASVKHLFSRVACVRRLLPRERRAMPPGGAGPAGRASRPARAGSEEVCAFGPAQQRRRTHARAPGHRVQRRRHPHHQSEAAAKLLPTCLN